MISIFVDSLIDFIKRQLDACEQKNVLSAISAGRQFIVVTRFVIITVAVAVVVCLLLVVVVMVVNVVMVLIVVLVKQFIS